MAANMGLIAKNVSLIIRVTDRFTPYFNFESSDNASNSCAKN
jgi:hypothetical protein